MLFKTLQEARNVEPQFASWRDNVVERVVMGGRELWRVVVFDQCQKCKRCRNSQPNHTGPRHRIASSGHTCDRCYNPYAGFVRRSVRRVLNWNGGPFWEALPHVWGSSGRLH